METLHLIANSDSELTKKICSSLHKMYNINYCMSWDELPGENDDPKILLRPTTPVIACVKQDNIEDITKGLESLAIQGKELDKRHPVLMLAEHGLVGSLDSLVHAHDDFLNNQFSSEELQMKINRIINRTDSFKKLSRDLNEASEIALLSMSHSSELGEISRFILKSYKCKTYTELFSALFETTSTFLLECSALVIVDDAVTVESCQGIVTKDLKETLLKHHGKTRVATIGKMIIISYAHGSIMIHNMPQGDPARHGRISDNMAVLGNCFEARVNGIEAEQKAESAARAKTMFLATMSHELRTPMNSVIGYTGRLIKKLTGKITEKELKQLDAIRRNGDHLLNLINDILDMSKIEVGQMEIFVEPVNITVLLKNVFDQLYPIAMNHQLGFEIGLDVDNLSAQVDSKRFTQIIMNLISNAIKYTKEGSVHIGLSRKDIPDMGDAIAIAVTDTGIGITPENVERLFGNFVQIDSALTRTVEGSGLGLAISEFFAKKHGGRIDVTSEEGKGSCFTLLIPIVS